MTSFDPRPWRILRRLALAIGLGALSAFITVSPAFAHGKEVTIKLTCRAAKASTPLERTCSATVVASNDGDPVTDARLTLTAVRPGKADDGLMPVTFSPEGKEGRYGASFTLPAYGTWLFSVEIEKPAEGQVTLNQEILPPSGADSPAAQAQVQLLRAFDLRDVANIVFLGFHLIGTVAVLVANASILVLARFVDGPAGIRLRRSAVRLFPWLVLASFGLLAISGAYNAAYNSPTSSPGLYAPGRVASLPFGDAYVALFALKMALAVVLFGGTTVLVVALRRAPGWRALPIAGASQASTTAIEATSIRRRRPLESGLDSCMALALLNLLTGAGILVLVLVIDYLHLLSHAQSLAGGV